MTNAPLVIVHANCQGEPLAAFLRRVPELAGLEVRLFTNYVREPVTRDDLDRCALFLYQPLGEAWGELASARLLAGLPSQARTLAFPPMFLHLYWPFWVNRASGPDYPDALLDRLLDEGADPAQAVRVAQRPGVVLAHDPDAIWERSLARERAKEEACAVRHVDAMLARCRREMAFTLVNHPGHAMLCWLGRRILEELSFSEPPEGVEAAMPELHPEFRLPVHPVVAEHFGLTFAGPEVRYPVYGRELTWAEYALEYCLARSQGIDDLIGFLRVRAGEGAPPGRPK